MENVLLRRIAVTTLACFTLSAAGPIPLFNGKNLDGFDIVTREHPRNQDPNATFRVHDGMIHISGQDWGYLLTKDEYSDYRLTAEFKWGDATHGKRKLLTRDSGILFHVSGPDIVWPKSFEFQIIEGGTGDLIVVKKTSLTMPGGKKLGFRADRIGKGPWRDVTGYRDPENELERPKGEWNRLELIADGQKITFYVNGKLANQGFDAEPSRGKILLQSEGAEIYFRNIVLHPLTKE